MPPSRSKINFNGRASSPCRPSFVPRQWRIAARDPTPPNRPHACRNATEAKSAGLKIANLRKINEINAIWRRGRDSNPRYPCRYAAFRVRCIQPLCHLSDRGVARLKCVALVSRVYSPRHATAGRNTWCGGPVSGRRAHSAGADYRQLTRVASVVASADRGR